MKNHRSTKEFILPKIKVVSETLTAINSGSRIVCHQGGSRSGKTFSIVQVLIYLALTRKLQISVCSLSFPHLRKGAMRDWRKIMEDFGLYEESAHMKTEQLYTYPNGSYIEFFSVDNALKVRGPGRDIVFVNECNLIEYDTLRQLLLRTKMCAIIDYNPADEFHWIYDKIIPRPNCHFVKTTYLDNPFLPYEQVKEIESYREVDENFWRIYGEGERGHSEGVIFTHWDTYNRNITGNVSYGLDFGFNNPTSLVKVTESDKEIFAEEVLYQSHLTNPDLIRLVKQLLPPHAIVYCDTAEPARIEELRRAGIQAKPADKDVKAGILFLKSRKLHVHAQSANLLKEIKSYKFMGKENKDLIPLKVNDHACDAMRYACTGIRQPVRQSSPMFIR